MCWHGCLVAKVEGVVVWLEVCKSAIGLLLLFQEDSLFFFSFLFFLLKIGFKESEAPLLCFFLSFSLAIEAFEIPNFEALKFDRISITLLVSWENF